LPVTDDLDDDRVTCAACQHFKAGRCTQARRAGISPHASIEIGRTLAELPQRCPAFMARKTGEKN